MRHALALTLSLLVVVALLETTLRMLQPDRPPELFGIPGNCLRRSALLGVEYKPRCKGRVHTWRVATNSLGLRGRGVEEDSIRVLAVGASIAFGFGVNSFQTYPMQLEYLLNRDRPRPRYQVVNAGVPGYTSYQGLLYFRERGLALNPAFAIVGFGLNDAHRSGDIEAAIMRQRRALQGLEVEETPLRSALIEWVRSLGRPLEEPQVSVSGFERNYAEIVRLAASRDVKLIFLSFMEDGNPYHGVLQRLAEVHEIPLVEYAGPRLDPVHPTPIGYKVLARQIWKEMIARGYVPPPLDG